MAHGERNSPPLLAVRILVTDSTLGSPTDPHGYGHDVCTIGPDERIWQRRMGMVSATSALALLIQRMDSGPLGSPWVDPYLPCSCELNASEETIHSGSNSDAT